MMSDWEKDLSDDEKDLDWSWVRWQRLRWNFVTALEKSSLHQGDQIEKCSKSDCCSLLTSLLPYMGATLNSEEAGHSRLTFSPAFREMCTRPMDDGMTMLSAIHQSQLFKGKNILSGFMEVPQAVGRTIHSEYFGYREPLSGPHVGDDPSQASRELAYAFTCLAFPDSYLAWVHARRQMH